MKELMPTGAPKKGTQVGKGAQSSHMARAAAGCSPVPIPGARSSHPKMLLLPIEPGLVAGFRTKCKNCEELRTPTPALGKETENVPFSLARPPAIPFIQCSGFVPWRRQKKTLPATHRLHAQPPRLVRKARCGHAAQQGELLILFSMIFLFFFFFPTGAEIRLPGWGGEGG